MAHQLGRTLENMAAFLAEGGMRLTDLAAATVYLRGGEVCRPDWLVEIEAPAVCPHNATFPRFI